MCRQNSGSRPNPKLGTVQLGNGSVAEIDLMNAPLLDSLPQVFLNHFYVVLDSSTYKAIEEDTFLRRHFAVNEKRTTTNAEMSYTGLYFYGINTYFEFFDIGNSPKDQVGDSAIAFGVDRPGAIKVLQEKLG